MAALIQVTPLILPYISSKICDYFEVPDASLTRNIVSFATHPIVSQLALSIILPGGSFLRTLVNVSPFIAGYSLPFIRDYTGITNASWGGYFLNFAADHNILTGLALNILIPLGSSIVSFGCKKCLNLFRKELSPEEKLLKDFKFEEIFNEYNKIFQGRGDVEKIIQLLKESLLELTAKEMTTGHPLFKKLCQDVLRIKNQMEDLLFGVNVTAEDLMNNRNFFLESINLINPALAQKLNQGPKPGCFRRCLHRWFGPKIAEEASRVEKKENSKKPKKAWGHHLAEGKKMEHHHYHHRSRKAKVETKAMVEENPFVK